MTIPADIMKTAREAYLSAFNEYGQAKDDDVYSAIASALLAERERCAKVAETGMYHGTFQTAGDKRRAYEIAAAIRKGDTA